MMKAIVWTTESRATIESKKEQQLQSKLDSLDAEVTRLTLELEQARDRQISASRDLEGERETLVSEFLSTRLTPKSLLFELDYERGVVSITPDVDGHSEAGKIRSYLKRSSLEDLPLIELFGYYGESPINA